MNIAENKTFQETSKKITDTLFIILKEKSIKKITVKELCQNAGINRSTFYAHFRDLYEVLENAETKMSSEVSKAMFNDEKSLYCSLEDLLKVIEENKFYFRIYFKVFKDTKIVDIMISEQREKARHIIINNSPDIYSEEDIYYYFDYVKSGIDAIINRWILNDCKESTDKILNIITKSINGLDDLFENRLQILAFD